MKALLIAALVGCLAVPAVADVIEFKTGQRVEGTFRQATNGKVTIEVAGQTLTVEQDKVRAIYFGAESEKAFTPAARAEGFRALRALQSVIGVGVTYRDYMTRLGDTQIVVDRYLREERGPIAEKINTSLYYYKFAAEAWSTRLSRGSFVAFATNPLIEACQPAQRVIDGFPYSALGGTLGLSAIWQCASEKLDEAERAAGEWR